jgi:hypothetical protein
MTARTAPHAPVGDLYLVICGNFDPEYTPERYLRDMTWAGTVKDIAGRQFPSLNRVIEIGTGRDVTAAMLIEAGLPVADAPRTGQDAIDWQRDHVRDQRKHESA